MDGYELLEAAKDGEGTIEAALAALQQEVADYPFDANRQAWLADALQEAERWDESLEWADRAVDLDDEFAPAHYLRAKALYHGRRFAEAAAAARQATTLDSRRAAAWFLLANASQKSGDDDAAVAAADVGEQHSPDNPWPYFLRGLVYEKRGDLPAAEFEFQAACARNPLAGKYVAALAFVVLKQGRVAEATQLAAQALELDPSNRASTEIARHCARVAQPEPSRAHAIGRALTALWRSEPGQRKRSS